MTGRRAAAGAAPGLRPVVPRWIMTARRGHWGRGRAASLRAAMPRLAPARLALALTATVACSDGHGPEGGGEPRLLVVRSTNAAQSVWQYAGESVQRVLPDSVRFVHALARAADGRIAYITWRFVPEPGRYVLVEVAANGRLLRSVDLQAMNEMSAGPPTELSYSPDGTRLAWRSSRDGGIDSLFVLDAGATTRRGLAARAVRVTVGEEQVTAAPLRWTPNGRLVFGAPGSLVGLHASSGDPLTLAENLGRVRDFDFTADGRLVVVTQQPTAATARIVAQRVQGGTLVHVPNSAPLDPRAVRWTLDGQRIATTAIDSVFRGGLWRHYAEPILVEVDGSGTPLRIEDVAVWALHGWTGDGRIVLTGDARDGAWLYRDVYVAAFGGAVTNVTNTPTSDEVDAVPLGR